MDRNIRFTGLSRFLSVWRIAKNSGMAAHLLSAKAGGAAAFRRHHAAAGYWR
jgi:hypothetical protein